MKSKKYSNPDEANSKLNKFGDCSFSGLVTKTTPFWQCHIPASLMGLHVDVCTLCKANCPYAIGREKSKEEFEIKFNYVFDTINYYNLMERSLLSALSWVGDQRELALTAIRAAKGESDRWDVCRTAREEGAGCPFGQKDCQAEVI